MRCSFTVPHYISTSDNPAHIPLKDEGEEEEKESLQWTNILEYYC